MIDFQSRKRAVCSGSTLGTEYITDIGGKYCEKGARKGFSGPEPRKPGPGRVVPHSQPACWPSSRIGLNFPAGASLVEGCSVLFMDLRLCVACYPLRQLTRALTRLVGGIPCWGLELLVGMVSEQGKRGNLAHVNFVPCRHV